MPRRKKIDRDAILDAAEHILGESGAPCLTLDAVAERAGISKGGLTYNFASKEALLSALIERETAGLRQGIEKLRAGQSGGSYPDLAALIHLLRQDREPDRRKTAKTLAALMHSPESLQSARDFLQWMAAKFSGNTPADRHARLIFMAVQGVFLLNGLGLLEIPRKARNHLLQDAQAVLSGSRF